jgi:hypothetical protein
VVMPSLNWTGVSRSSSRMTSSCGRFMTHSRKLRAEMRRLIVLNCTVQSFSTRLQFVRSDSTRFSQLVYARKSALVREEFASVGSSVATSFAPSSQT